MSNEESHRPGQEKENILDSLLQTLVAKRKIRYNVASQLFFERASVPHTDMSVKVLNMDSTAGNPQQVLNAVAIYLDQTLFSGEKINQVTDAVLEYHDSILIAQGFHKDCSGKWTKVNQWQPQKSPKPVVNCLTAVRAPEETGIHQNRKKSRLESTIMRFSAMNEKKIISEKSRLEKRLEKLRAEAVQSEGAVSKAGKIDGVDNLAAREKTVYT